MNNIQFRTIMYDITMNCNLRCKHCYNAEYLQTGIAIKVDLPRILNAFSKINFKSIVIQGGEPLMVSNLEELIAQLRQRQIYVSLTTNTTLLTPERTVSLIKSGVNAVFFSIESASEKINDSIRGKGTFHQSYKNIKNFMSIYSALHQKQYIPPMLPVLSCTVSSLNFSTEDSIQQMFVFARELGISEIAFNFLVDYGGGKALMSHETMTDLELAEKIACISREFSDIRVRLPMKQIGHDWLKGKYGTDLHICGAKGKCPAGSEPAYVDANLNMYPCAALMQAQKTIPFVNENVVSLNDNLSPSVFDTFLKRKDRYCAIYQECSTCGYKDRCIPVCPCLEDSEIEKLLKVTCPTRREIRGMTK